MATDDYDRSFADPTMIGKILSEYDDPKQAFHFGQPNVLPGGLPDLEGADLRARVNAAQPLADQLIDRHDQDMRNYVSQIPLIPWLQGAYNRYYDPEHPVTQSEQSTPRALANLAAAAAEIGVPFGAGKVARLLQRSEKPFAESFRDALDNYEVLPRAAAGSWSAKAGVHGVRPDPYTMRDVLPYASMRRTFERNPTAHEKLDELDTKTHGVPSSSTSDQFTPGEYKLRRERMMRDTFEDLRRYYGDPPVVRPGADKGFSLSKNEYLGTDPGAFQYRILKDARPVGSIDGNLVGPDNPEAAYIHGMFASEDLGLSGIKAIREHLRQDFPEIKTFIGSRISGARRGPAMREGASHKQTVRIPQWLLPGAIGAGTAAPTIDDLLSRYNSTT